MSGSTITYPRPVETSTQQVTLETEYRIDTATGNQVKTEWYMTLDPGAVPQVSTVTITAGSTGDDYVISLTSNAVTKAYRHKQEAGETATAIATFLATLINTNPAVKATNAAGVITITSLVPGQAFTLANTGSTTTGNVTIATTTANAGTSLHRKIGEATVTFSVSSKGYPEVALSGKWFDGAAIPVQKQVYGPLKGVGYTTIDLLQTAAGIDRSS